MKLIITAPDNVSWHYELTSTTESLLKGFTDGILDRIIMVEEAPNLQKDWPMRFELQR